MTIKELFLQHTKFAKVLLCLTLVFIMSIVVGFSGNNKTIYIVADGQTKTIRTSDDNPQNIIKQAGVKFAASDKYTISTQNITTGTTITIHRNVPVKVQVDNNTKVIETNAADVKALVKKLGYNPLDYDTEPGVHAELRPNMLIKLEPLIAKITFRNMQEPFGTVYREDDSLEKGKTKVVQQGQEGTARLMVKEYYKGGTKVDEEILQKSVTAQPVPEVVAKGTYQEYQADSGYIPPYEYAMDVEATAYLPSDGSGSGYTATGMRAGRGVVAVDPNVIPYGTRLYISGYGEAVAADTGGFSGRRIDLCMESYSEAIGWGRRDVRIYILK